LYKVQILGGTSATQKIEKEVSSEMLVRNFQSTRRHKPEDRNSDIRLRQKLKFHKQNCVFKFTIYLIFYKYNFFKPFKAEAQTALFKDPVRTAL
jgi:hypothetical protein